MSIKHATDEILPAPTFASGVAADGSRSLRLAAVLYRLVGPKISAMFLATIPTGLVLGAIEVATAFVLFLVLARFHLVSSAGQPAWIPSYLDPLLLLAAVTILATVLRYLNQVLPNLANSAFESRIRQALAEAALNGRGEESNLSVAEVSHVANALVSKTGGFIQALMSCIGIFSLLILVTAELIHLSWVLTAFSMAGAAVLGLPMLWFKQIYGKFSDRAYEFHRAFTYRFLKDVRNAEFLKVCGLNRLEAEQLGYTARSARANSRIYALLFTAGNNLPYLAGVILIVGLLWSNERWALMPTAGLVPFVYLLNRVTGSLVSLSTSSGQVRELLPYVFEMSGYTEVLFPKIQSAFPAGRAVQKLSAIEVRALAFGRRAPLTEPISFAVKSGEMALISGPSGRGKSTLLMTILGMIPPLGGEAIWDGNAVEQIDPVSLRRRIGFAGPEPYLIDANIRTNLLFGLEGSAPADAEIDHALHIACAEFVHELKGGLSYELREHGDGISAGQKQRLVLARCILRRPDVLILDEATANIDEETEQLFFERLHAAYPRMMIVAVSHRSSLRNFANIFIEI